MVLGTSDYNKISTLLQDEAYAKLKKDPTEDRSPPEKLIF
jgi:hypothetical protein